MQSGWVSIIMCIGPPGSGKTTWVNMYKLFHPAADYFSSDALRREIFGNDTISVSNEQNQQVHDEMRQRVAQLIKTSREMNNGCLPEIVIDATNCSAEEWAKYKAMGPNIMIAKVFEVNPVECVKRMELRERKVPADAICKYWHQYQQNKPLLPQFFNIIDYNPYLSLYRP